MKIDSGINKTVTRKFGLNIQRFRDALGLTREELAEKASTSPQNIARIENGQRFVSSELLLNISKALGVTASDLFADDKVSKSLPPSWYKIERLLKSRSEDELNFAHSILSMIFKKISKIER